MNGKFSLWVFMSVVMIIPVVVFMAVNWYEKKYESLPILGYDNLGTESFSLKNQNGEVTTDKAFTDKIVVVDFFFTHCPSICPKMTKNLKMVQQAMESDPAVMINSFSIDPERDSVRRLAEYAAKFKVEKGWNLLTGDKKVIYRLARKSFMVDASEGDGGPNDFIHSDKFVLIDASGRIRGYYKGTSLDEVEQMIIDIGKLKKEDNPDSYRDSPRQPRSG